jgi:hypothetical protein
VAAKPTIPAPKLKKKQAEEKKSTGDFSGAP